MPKVWDIPGSTLTVPLRIPMAAVQAWTEAAVPETIRGEDSGVRTLKAWFVSHDWHYRWSYDLKRTPLVLGWKDQRLWVSSHLSGVLKASWDTLPGQARSEVEADAGVEASLSVAGDWTLRPRTRVFVDVVRAQVPIGIVWDGTFFGQVISIAGPLEEALKPTLVDLGTKLEAVGTIDLKPAVGAAWDALQEPRQLPGAQGLWFTLSPQSLALGSLKGTVDGLEVDLTMAARPALTLGDRPRLPVVSLPPAGSASSQASRWSVTMPVSLAWAEVARAALDRLPPGPIAGPNGARLWVRSLAASTDGDRVLVRVEAKASPPWSGPVDTVLWFGARPAWDPVTRNFGLTGATLDARSADVLVQGAAWLVGGAWIGTLEAAMRWEAGSELDTLRDQASAALTALPVGPHLRLSASLDTLTVTDFTLTDTGPILLTTVEGASAVTWVP